MIENRVIGRTKLKQRIEESYNNKINGNRDIILVKGNPGIGKTYSIRNILKDYSRLKVIECKQSKGEINQFELISDLLEKLFTEILMLDDELYKPLVYRLTNELGTDLGYIANFTDLFKKIFTKTKAKIINDYSREKYRVRKVIRNFFKIVSFVMDSLCFFIDDLQWANIQSNDIIKSLIKDRAINAIFIIAYRTGFDEFEKEEKKFTLMELQSFSEEEIDELIKEYISKNTDGIKYLSRYLFSITLGNPFYIVKSLEELKEKNIIENGLIKIDKFSRSKTGEDIDEIMLSRIKTLKFNEKKVLEYISCLLGNCYKENINIIFDDSSLEKSIMSLKNKNLIFETKNRYMFSHDIVLEYIDSNIEEWRKKDINFEIAYKLYKNNKPIHTLTQNILTSNLELWEIEFAKDWFYNLYDYAKHSMENQLYSDCLKVVKIINYAKKFIEVDEKLNIDIDLIRCKCMYMLGEFSETEKMYFSMLDKYESGYELQIYDEILSLYRYLGNDNKVLDIGKKMLSILEYDYNIFEIDKHLNKLSKPFDLPKKFIRENKNKYTRLYVFYRIIPSAKVVSNDDFLYIMLSMAIISLEEENSEYTLFGYVALAYVMFNITDNFDYAKYFSDIVFENIDKLDDIEFKVELSSFYLTFVHHWSNNIENTIKLLENINTECIENGIIPHFSYTLVSLLFAYSNIGKNIDESINIIEKRSLNLYDTILSENSFLKKYVNVMVSACKNILIEGIYDSQNVFKDNIKSQDFLIAWFTILVLFLKKKFKDTYEIFILATDMFDEAKGHIVYADILFIAALTRLMYHKKIEFDYEKEENKKEIDKIKEFFSNNIKNYNENNLLRYLYITAAYENNFGNRYLTMGLISEGLRISKEKNNYMLLTVGDLLAFEMSYDESSIKEYYKKEMIKNLDKLGAKAVLNSYTNQYSDDNTKKIDINLLSKKEFFLYFHDSLREKFNCRYSALILLRGNTPKIISENKKTTRIYTDLIVVGDRPTIKKDLIKYSIRTKDEIISKSINVYYKSIPLIRADLLIGIVYLEYDEKYDIDISKFIYNCLPNLIIKIDDNIKEEKLELYDILTSRELDILKLLSKGKSNKEISEIESISVSTVKTHLSKIYRKFEVNSRMKAVDIGKKLKIL